MKHENGIPVWPSYTVRLELDLKTPVKASSVICCTTQLIETTGRKIWLSAKLEVCKSVLAGSKEAGGSENAFRSAWNPHNKFTSACAAPRVCIITAS